MSSRRHAWFLFPPAIIHLLLVWICRAHSDFGSVPTPPLCDASSKSHGALFSPAMWQASFFPGREAWSPAPDRFLLLYCARGQISNRVLCLRNHMALAGLLNRTLVIPAYPREVPGRYDMQVVLDLSHARLCLGRPVLLSTVEFNRRFRSLIPLGRVACWHAPSAICPAPDKELFLNCPANGAGRPSPALQELNSALGTLPADRAVQTPVLPSGLLDTQALVNTTFLKRQYVRLPAEAVQAPVQAACLPQTASKSAVLRAFGGLQDRVLLVGDLVNVAFSDWPAMERALDLPFIRRPACPDAFVVRPAAVMFRAAEAARRDLFGDEPYAGLHWRRGDFKAYCFWHGPKNACFFPPKQVGWWLFRQMAALRLRNLFVATNAKRDEMLQLQAMLDASSNSSIRVKRLTFNSSLSAEWRSLLQPLSSRGQSALLLVALEKLLCAQAAVFFGSPVSTFSNDIARARHGLRTASCRDTTICEGEKEMVRNRGR